MRSPADSMRRYSAAMHGEKRRLADTHGINQLPRSQRSAGKLETNRIGMAGHSCEWKSE